MDIIFCIECGYKLPGTAKFCKKCGVAISLSEVDLNIEDIKMRLQSRRGSSAINKYQRFSEKARRVLSNAQLEAQRLKQDYIGTEHILLSIIIETTSTANQILSNIGIDLDNLKTDIEMSLKPNQSEINLSYIGLTATAKKVIDCAVSETRILTSKIPTSKFIGTEHLLVGILCGTETFTYEILSKFGVSIESVRSEIAKLNNDSNT